MIFPPTSIIPPFYVSYFKIPLTCLKLLFSASWIFHIQVTLLLYTCIRAPLIILLLIGLTNSLIFEILRHVNTEEEDTTGIVDQGQSVFLRVFSKLTVRVEDEIPTNNSRIVKLVFAEVFLQLATHCICAKHSNQTDDDLYLSYKRVIDVVKMSAKHEKEKPRDLMYLYGSINFASKITSISPMIIAETNFPISGPHSRILRNRFVMEQNG